MAQIITHELSDLVNPPHTESISGRRFGEEYAKKINLLESIDNGYIVDIRIDGELVKAINDSFIKGLFSKIFMKYKTLEEVKKRVKITSNDFFKNLFEKNWIILQELINA